MIFSNRKPKLAILISGRGSNMKALLQKISEKKLPAEVVLVFSDKREATGLTTAESFGVKTLSFSPKQFKDYAEYEQNLVNVLLENGVEWVVCAGYMRILRKQMLHSFRNRIVNVHPSLLPSFPGLGAQRQAVEYAVKYSGCTIHFVDDGVDSGAIILQETVELEPNETEETLSRKIIKIEHELYWKALHRLFKGFTLEGRKVIFNK
ncbi:MAG: phosphoribosylglycinamide formyltransferase [Leptospirales bacterium]